MKTLLYVGKFLPWNDKNEDALFDALETFDQVIIGVMFDKNQSKLKKGQPSKLIDPEYAGRVSFVNVKSLKKYLADHPEQKYIMFDR